MPHERKEPPQTILLTVRVRASAKQPGIKELGAAEYQVSVVSPPEKGKANREVVAALAEHFGIPASWVRIVHGQKSRLKLVAIQSYD